MLTVARQQIFTPNHYKIGDQVHIPIEDVAYAAIAIKRQNQAMLFIFDQCIGGKRFYMHHTAFRGEWEDTDLRKKLQLMADTIPRKIKKQMIPFENGDYLRLLYESEVFCVPKNKDNFIPWFTNISHRVKRIKDGDFYVNWWLATPIEIDNRDHTRKYSDFKYVNYQGDNGYCGESVDYKEGVVPVFQLKDNFLVKEV